MNKCEIERKFNELIDNVKKIIDCLTCSVAKGGKHVEAINGNISMTPQKIEKLRKGAEILKELEEIIKSMRKGEELKIGCGTGLYLGGHRTFNHRFNMDDVMLNSMRAGILNVFNEYANVLRNRIDEL